MTPERWQQIKKVLASALELRAEEREEYLAAACAGDPEMLAEVRELISLSFLDSVDASPANEVLRLHFGPSLRAEAARRDGWTES